MDVMLRDRSAGKELSKYDGKDGRWRRYEMKKMLKNVICCAQRYVYEVPIDDGCTACVALIRGNHIIVANAGDSRCVISRDGQRYVYEVPIDDGCTACVALIRGNRIIVANAGDSRCVISRDGQAIALSTNQKPNFPAETQRIQGAGCQVTQERGDDLRYKDNALAVPDQAATAFPEVHTEERIAGTKFLVIACDGIWDCMTDQEVADCIKIYIDDVKPAAICVHLPDHCLSLLRGIAKLSRADCLAARRGRRDQQHEYHTGY